MEENITIPLHEVHVSLGGKMVPFGGFILPVRYSSDIEEHLTVRSAVGLFDVSHMGEFSLSGPGALSFIQQMTTNDAASLTIGKVQYSALTNEQGGIIDDLLVYRLGEEEYYLVVNASNIEKDKNWLLQHLPDSGVSFKDESSATCLFALQGPKAVDVLQTLTTYPVDQMPYYTNAKIELRGLKDILISTTGYTGAGGFEIYVPLERAEFVWRLLMEKGAAWGIKPCGLGARDTLRLEMGYCLYGNDMNDTINPIEAGLGWITKLNKNFIGSEPIRKAKTSGVSKKLVGFILEERGIPRSHYELYTVSGDKKIGEVTSGTQSPCLQQGIGMGYVAIDYAVPDTLLAVQIRGKMLRARVVALPFVKGTI
ncbi:MAG: glycine cleavage system aminomethyltransferase GcvT [Cytophagaceae bacterium]|jgi:aminomethyltransferase|nr:glycine cleavage system aminomethyltransferase GcvT [Cytophagaceae bacterium]